MRIITGILPLIGVVLIGAFPLTADAAQKKARTPMDNLIDNLIGDLVEVKRVSPTEEWADWMRQLIEIGKPAVLPLVAKLDEIEGDRPVRMIAFALRAIDDPRAIPGLIRNLPKAAVPAGSDYGLMIRKNPELLAFMQQHDVSKRDGAHFTFGLPPRELLHALWQLTGTNQSGQAVMGVHLHGSDHQRRLQRKLYEDLAIKWADWWNANGRQFVADPKFAKLQIVRTAHPGPPPSITEFETGPHMEVGGGWSGMTIGSIGEKGRNCFNDLDANYRPNWPAELPAPGAADYSSDRVIAWAEKTGVDFVGDQYESASGKRYYCLRTIGLRAWQVADQRWDSIEDEITRNEPLQLGKPAGQLLIPRDDEKNYTPEQHGTFLFITRDGSCGILRSYAQVTETWGPAGPPRTAPFAIDREARRKSNKGFSKGLRIEYKFFYRKRE